MKPTFEEAQAAAQIIRQYMNGEKCCTHWNSREADEIFNCSYILQWWTYDGQITMQHINTEFEVEYEWAHRTAVYNYHMEEASCGLL